MNPQGSYRLNLMKVSLILVIFAWAKNRVPIPSMGFGIGDKLADVMHVTACLFGTDTSTLDPSLHKKY